MTIANQDSKGLSNNAHLALPTSRHEEIYPCPLARFGLKARPIPEVVNSAQTCESREIKKVAAPKETQKSLYLRFTRAKGEV